MILEDACNDWLKQHIGDGVNENTRFVMKIAAKEANSTTDIEVPLDVVWHILLNVDAPDLIKLQVAQSLLKLPKYQINFKSTIVNPLAKRLLAEFLLFNPIFVEGLKGYIDFNKLDAPMDFVSYALFVTMSLGAETPEISAQRIKSINIALEMGYQLPENYTLKDEGAIIRKILQMSDDVPDKYKVANKLLKLGFKLFTANQANNTEAALILLDSKSNPECQDIIKRYIAGLKNIILNISEHEQGNLADYFYWVKEDMETVEFLKSVGIERTSNSTT